MQCSACKNEQLEPQELEPGLIAAVCNSCRGTLVSLMNYRFWIDRYASSASVVRGSEEENVVESESARACPKCSRLMLKYQIGPHSNHKLDLCAACDEVWLDSGEWTLLKKLDLQGKLPKIFTDAWQRNIRKQKQEHALNERYENILGTEDFSKAREFRTWLYKHPKKDSIKQYLISHQD